ncbi:MAG TPA: hypothetical protein VMK13_02900 [Streptosporangiaceae bacterium]|nr:hypothetical protein [Streptosporangiaceae bacterium]
MGLHGADPAGRRRYVAAGMVITLVIVMLAVGALATRLLVGG